MLNAMEVLLNAFSAKLQHLVVDRKLPKNPIEYLDYILT